METIKVYKLLGYEKGKVYPLFIDAAEDLPIGVWLTANTPNEDALERAQEGYSLISLRRDAIIIHTDKKPKCTSVLSAIFICARWVQIKTDKRGKRKVYDLGLSSNGKQVVSFAHRPGWHSSATPSLPAVDMTGKVWAECLIPADDYYTLHRNVSGLSRTHEPIDWYISKKIFITRLLDI